MDERPAPPWAHCFVDPATGGAATIQLAQVDVKKFALLSSLAFTGQSDVDAPREVGPDSLPFTDLTSVPGPLRWFVSPYGLHSPAALLHDRLVGDEAPDGFARSDADRLFRHMLDCLGVPFLRRWLMWAAVAYGTRWSAKGLRRVAIVLWTLVALAGMAVLGVAAATMSLPLVALAAVLPFPAALLWGRQYGGGLIAAASGPWLALPAIIAATGYGFYWLLEKALSLVPSHRLTREPAPPKDF